MTIAVDLGRKQQNKTNKHEMAYFTFQPSMTKKGTNHTTDYKPGGGWVSFATKVVCFSRLLKCLRSLYGKQCGPRSDCSYRSSLFWVDAVCFYNWFISNVRQLFAADDFSRHYFQMHFFLGALRVKRPLWQTVWTKIRLLL